VLALENDKTAQDLEITYLKKRVKRLEKKRKSRTPQRKRRLFRVMIESSTEKSLDDLEDCSKQGRKITKIDQDPGILLHVRGYSFDEIKTLFETTMRRVNTFVSIESEVDKVVPELAARSLKRDAEEELDQGGSKRDDLVMLWSLVKEKFNSTKPIDDKEREIWRLYDSCGVHHVSTKKGIDIYMLVEKEYPLSRGTLTLMVVTKLLLDENNEMSKELLRKIFMQVERRRI
nr:hypothetical protein [Tanacetum cinerariifolium]